MECVRLNSRCNRLYMQVSLLAGDDDDIIVNGLKGMSRGRERFGFWTEFQDGGGEEEMDVLFGSIDVRDLLSTQDLEDTSPLSAPDLRLLIDRLNLRSLHIKQKVLSYLSSHHSHFSHLLNLSSQSYSKTLHLSSDLSALLSLLSSPSSSSSSSSSDDAQITNLAKNICSTTNELRECKEALHLLRCISTFIQRLGSVKEDLSRGLVLEAAEAVRDLKKVIGNSGLEEDAAPSTPLVFRLLQEEWMHFFDEVQEVLANIMENAVVFELEKREVRVKLRLAIGGIDNLDLRTVLKAMDVAGVLDYGLAKVADSMVKHVVVSIVRDGSDIDYAEICQHSQQKDVAILCLTSPPKSQVLPDDAAKVAEFQNVVKVTAEFENALKEMMFISTTDSKDSKLSTYAENVEVHFASRKKIEILAKARNLLMQCEFVLPLENVRKSSNLHAHGFAGKFSEYAVDLLFQPDRCLVSKAASQLMELVHQTLQNIHLSSLRVAMEFYHAARDSLLLYEAIVPVKLDIYRMEFPNGAKEHVVFADIALKFHQLGGEVLQKQIHLVIFSLDEAVDSADGFQNTHKMQQYESAKLCLDQVVFIIEKVRIIWEPLLLPSTYKRIMCKVLDSVFTRLTKDILLLDDMAADETLQLQRLIHIMLENLSSLSESLATDDNEKFSDNYLRSRLDKLLTSFRKLRKLAGGLDSSKLAWFTKTKSFPRNRFLYGRTVLQEQIPQA
ncbi:hypothetical protein ACLOJK_000732 [Asimina triloba]